MILVLTTARFRVTATLAILAGLALVAPARAEEAKTPISAALLLSIAGSPVDRRDAFDQALKEPGPAPRPPAGVVQPDGSVRYGDVTFLSVKNPCPPGTAHYEPPPLPGRRPRNY
jgi:hypothetical protein